MKRQSLLSPTLAVLLLSAPVCAQDTEQEFYHNKTISLVVGYSAGGGYDTYARLVIHPH